MEARCQWKYIISFNRSYKIAYSSNQGFVAQDIVKFASQQPGSIENLLKQKNNDGKTPLQIAIAEGNKFSAEALLYHTEDKEECVKHLGLKEEELKTLSKWLPSFENALQDDF